MAKHRTASTSQSALTAVNTAPMDSSEANGAQMNGGQKEHMPSIRLIPHHDQRATRPSLVFPPISRTLPSEDSVIDVGRYSERDARPNPPQNVPSSAPGGQWYIKDVKSSSGTFLNHIRLSSPSVESKPFPINDGDVVQLGIDFKGGEEMIFRCVKMRVEVNRGWQKSLNNFNTTTHKRLRALGKTPKPDSETSSTHSSECSICLMSIAPCQALFVAPCSHTWHYKCIRPILNDQSKGPHFMCPNCRAVNDLSADVEDMLDWEDEELEEGSNGLDVNMADVNGVETQSEPVRSAVFAFTTDASANDPVTASAFPQAEEQINGALFPSALFSRRNNNRSTSLTQQDEAELNLRNRTGPTPTPYLRPITPTQPLMGEEGFSPDDQSHPHLMPVDSVTSDGPMTPTNSAGPFVFDGSAGRAGGRRLLPATGGSPDDDIL